MYMQIIIIIIIMYWAAQEQEKSKLPLQEPSDKYRNANEIIQLYTYYVTY